MKNIMMATMFIVLLGCKKSTDAPPLPTIVINTPTDNQHFVKGDTIRITGLVTHTITLDQVGVHMTDMATKIEFFHNHYATGSYNNYNFTSKFAVTDFTKSTYKVEVEAMDKDGNTNTKEITITTN